MSPEKVERCVTTFMANPANAKRYPDEKERRSHAYAVCNAAIKGGEMSERFGYLTPIDSLELHENKSWVHALKPGKYNHPSYGGIEITPERLERFADNVKNNVRGIQLDIDYDHKRDGGKAAGWVQEAEVRDNGLWLNVEWTPDAAESLRKKEYRYLSPEYADEWTDASDNVHQDVLFGGALTNRPFLKDLAPLNFDEFFEEKRWDENVENYVFGTQFYRDIPAEERKTAAHAGKGTSFPIITCEDVNAAARSLGRAGPENFSRDQIKANIIRIANSKGFSRCLPEAWKMTEEVEMEEFIKKLSEALGVEGEEKILETVLELKEAKTAEETEADRQRKFAEDFPVEAKLLEEATKKLADEQAIRKLTEATVKVEDWTRGGMPAVVQTELRDFRVKLSGDDGKTFDEIIGKVLDAGLVPTQELGAGGGSQTDASEALEAAVAKEMSENDKLSYKEALSIASSKNPELARKLVNPAV